VSLISDRTKGGKQQEAKPVEANGINRPSEESRTRRPLNHGWVFADEFACCYLQGQINNRNAHRRSAPLFVVCGRLQFPRGSRCAQEATVIIVMMTERLGLLLCWLHLVLQHHLPAKKEVIDGSRLHLHAGWEQPLIFVSVRALMTHLVFTSSFAPSPFSRSPDDAAVFHGVRLVPPASCFSSQPNFYLLSSVG
jgi:hypothetical protein